jgi:hypothetical protein
MSFHKRYISKESILAQYSQSGIDGVKTHLRGADALFYSDMFSGVIVEMYHGISDSYDISDVWRGIEQEILNELPN